MFPKKDITIFLTVKLIEPSSEKPVPSRFNASGVNVTL